MSGLKGAISAPSALAHFPSLPNCLASGSSQQLAAPAAPDTRTSRKEWLPHDPAGAVLVRGLAVSQRVNPVEFTSLLCSIRAHSNALTDFEATPRVVSSSTVLWPH